MKRLKSTKPLCFLAICICLLFAAQPAIAWSNGGYSADPTHPDYGTHDWIAQHALDYLPANEKQYITDNLAAYLYGTELPDNSGATGGIGDTGKHHIYYNTDATLKDDSAAVRAREEYQKALTYLKNGDYAAAAKEAGTMSHYIDDVGVFGHVMGASTAWGTEKHHSDYEDHVNDNTGAYQASFNMYLHFDGALSTLSAYDAAKNLAYDTTFGGSSGYGCTWMDNNYNWNNQNFTHRCGQSLNLATNEVADVLHSLYQEANPAASTPTPTSTTHPTPTPTPTKLTVTPIPSMPEFPATQILAATMIASFAFAIVYKKATKKGV
jgi:hypothetical protein